MKTLYLSPLQLLDDGFAAAKQMALPWLGVLWLTSLPLTFLQVHYWMTLRHLGVEAMTHGDFLFHFSLLITAATVPALYGRALFVRQIASRHGGEKAAGELRWRLPSGPFLSYLSLCFFLDVTLYILCWTFVFIPVAWVLSALAAAIFPRLQGANLVQAVRELLSVSDKILLLALLGFVFLCAWLVACVNLYLGIEGFLWIADGVAGWDLTVWQQILQPESFFEILPAELLPYLLIFSAAWLLVLPFWLATLTIYVESHRAQTTGEDLHQWFASIRGSKVA